MMIGNGGDGQGSGTVANAYCASNTIIDALYAGVSFTSSTNIIFQNNAIISPGLSGIVGGPPTLSSTVIGNAILISNSVSGLQPGQVAFTNSFAGFVTVVPIMAANYGSAAGVALETCSEGGQDLARLTSGLWAAYNAVNLNGANAFVARVASATTGGNLEIHSDSPTGTLLGVCPVAGTGGWQNFTDVYCAVTNASGTHSVYLVFSGGAGNLFSLAWFGLFGVPPGYSHQLLPGNTYALKSALNGEFVAATNNGDFTLAASGASVGLPEEFQVYDAGGGNIGLLALVNTNYVCADNYGNNPLIANRTGVGSWETYTEFAAPDGNVGLQAMVNGKYVMVSNNPAATLIAQGASIGTAESFAVQFVSGLAPATPGGLAAAPGNSQIALTWAPSEGATGYNVMRSAAYGGTYSLLASNLPGVSYADTNLANGTTCYYEVSALNPAGESTNSAPVTTVVGALSRWSWTASASSSASGDAPANAIDGDITTRWSTGASQTNGMWFLLDMNTPCTFDGLVLNAASSSGDYPRGYQVNVSNDGVNWGSPVAAGSGSSALLNISFAPQTARFVRVTQTGSVSGLWWSIHEFNVLGTVPAAPAGLAANVFGTAASLSWTPGASAVGFNVKRGLVSGGPYTNIAWNLTEAAYADPGLVAGELYYYVVTATNEFGESVPSNEVAVRPVSTNSPIMNLAMTPGQMQLAWPSDHTGWRLQAQTNSATGGLGTNWATVTGSAATNSWVLPLVPANESVFFRLVYP
jgi:fibronectin type 3 domain-containing protein